MTEAIEFAGRVAVVIPTYNERDNIRPVTARVRAAVPGADLLIVDDNSPDGTGQIADELAAADKHIRVLHRPAKAGLGAAYIAGFQAALDQGYDTIVEMDADGSHQPEDLPKLLAALASPDLSSGLMAGAERRLAPFATTILAPGYDNGPAAGPGGRGFHKPRGFSFLDRKDDFYWSGGLRERVDPLPGGRDRLRPRPGRLDFQAAAAPAADQPGRGVQYPVAQRLGLGFGQVAVQG